MLEVRLQRESYLILKMDANDIDLEKGKVMKLYKNFGKKEKEMKKEKIQGIIDTVKQQELDLRFDSFSNNLAE